MTEIPLQILELEAESYHLLVDVKINKDIIGKMVVDTGASRTVLDANLSLDIEERVENPHTSGIGGEVAVSFAQIQSFQLGTSYLPEASFARIDLEYVNKVYEEATSQRIVGLLGSDLLVKYKAQIDYKNACLYLEC